MALNVLDRAVIKLERQNLYDDYYKVFLDQESEGIIERRDVSPDDFNKYVWVPCRPVIRKDHVCTTKIMLYFDLRPGQKCHSKVMHRKEVTHSNGSYERKSRGRKLTDEMGRAKKNSYGTLID